MFKKIKEVLNSSLFSPWRVLHFSTVVVVSIIMNIAGGVSLCVAVMSTFVDFDVAKSFSSIIRHFSVLTMYSVLIMFIITVATVIVNNGRTDRFDNYGMASALVFSAILTMVFISVAAIMV